MRSDRGMFKRQWLAWGALIAFVSFASYSYGALHQPKHALAATGGTVLTHLTTTNPTNHSVNKTVNASNPASTAANPVHVQIQVGKPESLKQWEGVTTPAAGSSNTSGSTNPQTSTPLPFPMGINPNSSWSSTISGILQSFGIPSAKVAVQGGERYLHAQFGSLPLAGGEDGHSQGKDHLFGNKHRLHNGHDH